MIEEAKRKAAHKAVDDYLKNNTVIGIGSGSTIVYAVERIAQIISQNSWNVKCVPTSFQSKLLIKQHKLNLVDLEDYQKLDVCFDGADEVDNDLTLIKGGGACLTQEKIVAFTTSKLVIVADYRKNSTKLGQNWSKGIPIEVIPLAYAVVKQFIESNLDGEVILRQAVNKAGPVITDNGNFILDWKFNQNKSYNWSEINTRLISIPGVLETGLFIDMARKVYFGNENGTISERG